MSGFKDVVGHKNIIKYIQNAVTADAVSHAYILNGERGSGKKLLANLFAMSLQCENRDEDGDACGKCRSCRQAAGGNQPDIIRIMHEKPNTIGVGDIRTQVNDDIMIRPYSSKYKIYIIADADMMSVEAQNALLKTIEEPPEYAVIMLLTEKNISWSSWKCRIIKQMSALLLLREIWGRRSCWQTPNISMRLKRKLYIC